ncbi:hypothetical protein [Candidatus Flexifilum breve]|uniref:hypothetical protein n=1 Tax=Candidatus Flexifilum breve TaxID=3140694 RepID=UPI0031CC9ED6
MARHFNRWSSIPIIGLRFSNIMEPHDYDRFQTWYADARVRKWNLWSYVDARDVAQSSRPGLESDLSGSHAFIIASADTCMLRTNADLMAEVFPARQPAVTPKPARATTIRRSVWTKRGRCSARRADAGGA